MRVPNERVGVNLRAYANAPTPISGSRALIVLRIVDTLWATTSNVKVVVWVAFITKHLAIWYAALNRFAGDVDASWGAWGRLSSLLEASCGVLEPSEGVLEASLVPF